MFRSATICLLVACSTVFAQHDPQRNATQSIAAGDLAEAEKILAKADTTDPETLFVRMMLELKRGQTEAALETAQAALDAGLPLPRLAAGPRELLGTLHESSAFQGWAEEYGLDKLKLLHGPMVGAVTDSSASFWVRTREGCKVQVKIGELLSDSAKSTPASDFTAVVNIDGLKPNTAYSYQVLLDGEPVAGGAATFTTFPKQGEGGKFSVAFGGGAGFVPEWEYMWDTIGKSAPSALLMMGDNVYIDQPKLTLCQHYCYHRRQERAEWRRLVASTPTYSIYDDHDFGTNDCIPGPEIEVPEWKRPVWRIFKQNWVNPGYGGGEAQPGCWYDFHIGDVHFIMLDGRYYRDLKGGSMLGPVQKAWLKKTLRESEGTFKVLASPVPWAEKIKPGSKDPWDGFAAEREEIFSFIHANEIPGVFLISADRHRTDLRTTAREDGYTLYEFESSKLTNRHTHKVVETPGLIGYNKKCSFGLMRFDTLAADPQVSFDCITIDGEIIHTHTLRASQLE
ncbi:MAG: alkaline phosphatase D family protein [Verrucomicrobiales bacterium]